MPILIQYARDSAFLTSSHVRRMLLASEPRSESPRLQNSEFTSHGHILSNSVLVLTLRPLGRSTVLLGINAMIAINAILGKEVPLGLQVLLCSQGAARVGGSPCCPRSPPSRSASGPPAPRLSPPPARQPRAPVFKQGPPRAASDFKGKQDLPIREGGNRHLSFLCGISKEEAPRRPRDKDRRRG